VGSRYTVGKGKGCRFTRPSGGKRLTASGTESVAVLIRRGKEGSVGEKPAAPCLWREEVVSPTYIREEKELRV